LDAQERLQLSRRVFAERDPIGPLRVAVITPYHAETEEQLRCCLRSVASQTYPCTHFVIGDGPRSPLPAVSDALVHIVLPKRHADYGDTPRAIGSISAMAQGFDAITYLDADNWYDHDHVERLVELWSATQADVCVASRSLHRLDGSLLSAGGDPQDGAQLVDTSCLFVTPAAYSLLPIWALLPARLHAIGDRVLWAAVRSKGLRVARLTTPTVRYRTAFRVHYEERGEPPPEGAKSNAPVLEAIRWWKALPAREREMVWARLGFRF
jgi:hypothetical protein